MYYSFDGIKENDDLLIRSTVRMLHGVNRGNIVTRLRANSTYIHSMCSITVIANTVLSPHHVMD